MILEKELLSAFNKGIERIICKHSKGMPLSEKVIPGIHKHREILFVLHGESEFPLNEKKFNIKAGDVILINRWISHLTGYPSSDRNMLYLWFVMFPTHLNLFVHQIDDKGNISYAVKWCELPTDLKMVIERRWDEFDKLSPESALASLDSFLKQPLQMLLDEFRFHFQLNNMKTEKTSKNHEIVHSIQHIIETKTGRDCSLAQLEKFTGFSRFYISHVFKEECGISIGEYINKVRMVFYEAAKNQGFSNKQIAFDLGFSTSSALLMWYRKAKEKIR